MYFLIEFSNNNLVFQLKLCQIRSMILVNNFSYQITKSHNMLDIWGSGLPTLIQYTRVVQKVKQISERWYNTKFLIIRPQGYYFENFKEAYTKFQLKVSVPICKSFEIILPTTVVNNREKQTK